MRTNKPLFLTLLLCLFGMTFLNSVSAQETLRVRAVKSNTTVKPLNAKALKLNAKASLVLQSWIKAKHMQIMRSGHFIPIKNPSSTRGGNLPGGSASNNLASGTNCAKIECPDVFDEGVTCWECH